MKNKIIWSFFLIIFTTFFLMGLLGCDQPKHHYVKVTKQKIHVYKQHKQDDIWIYWYIFYYNNNCYYYSSALYLTSQQYSECKWTESRVSPLTSEEINNPNEVQSVEENVVPNVELGERIDQQIESTEQQESDMINEGNPNNQDTDGDVGTGDDNSSDSGGDGD